MTQGFFRSRKTSHSIQIGEEIRVGEWGIQGAWELWRSVEWLIGICKSWEVLQTSQSDVLHCLTRYTNLREIVDTFTLLNFSASCWLKMTFCFIFWHFYHGQAIFVVFERLFYMVVYLGPADMPAWVDLDFDFWISGYRLTTLGESIVKKGTSGTCEVCTH